MPSAGKLKNEVRPFIPRGRSLSLSTMVVLAFCALVSFVPTLYLVLRLGFAHSYYGLFWSPDSRYLAFSRDWELHIYDTQTKRDTAPAIGNSHSYSIRGWSDARHLWLESGPLLSDSLVECDVFSLTCAPVTLPPNEEMPFLPDSMTFHPSGGTVVYSNYRRYGAEAQDGVLYSAHDLWQLDLKTGQATRLTHTPDINETAPQFSPDGRLLVAGDHYFQDGEWHVIPDFMADSGGYSLSPDAKWLLTIQKPDGLYLLPLDGSSPRRLILEGLIREVAWSPDGCYLAYKIVGVPTRHELVIISAQEAGLQAFIPHPELCH